MSGVAGLSKGIRSIAALKSALRDLPIRIRSSVAKDAAEVLNVEMRADYASARTVYDTPRPLSVDGKRLSLVKTGRTFGQLFFVVTGTILRAQLGTKYARFLIGKYSIMPQRLPAAWSAKLEKIVREYREDFEREALR